MRRGNLMRCPALGYRFGDPSRDLTARGTPVERNYIVVVRQHDGRQAVRLDYSTTSSGYTKKRTTKYGETYCHKYSVQSGAVFRQKLVFAD